MEKFTSVLIKVLVCFIIMVAIPFSLHDLWKSFATLAVDKKDFIRDLSYSLGVLYLLGTAICIYFLLRSNQKQ